MTIKLNLIEIFKLENTHSSQAHRRIFIITDHILGHEECFQQIRKAGSHEPHLLTMLLYY